MENLTKVLGTTLTVHPNQLVTARAICPSGDIATGGGWGTTGFMFIFGNSRIGQNVWKVVGGSVAGGDIQFNAFTYCMNPTYP